MSGKGKSKLTQSSKSTSSKKSRNKRDIISTPPYSEFPATTSTFSGLAGKLMKYGTTCAFFFAMFGVSNTYASSISISLTGNVNLNLLKDNNQPVFGTSNPQTVTVKSDHYTGYTFSISGNNTANYDKLIGSKDPTKYLTSIDTAINENTFRTNDTYNDKWGFLPNQLYNSNVGAITNSQYQPAPTAAGATIDVTDRPTSDTGNTYTLALGAKVSPEMALDSYGQTFILAATGNHYQYHIGYTDNSTNFPTDQYNDDATSGTVQLSSITPTKDGFVFRGWCPEPTTVNANTHETTCGVTPYQPGANINLSDTSANNFLLYAVWSKGYDTFADAFAGAGKTDSDKTNGYFRMQDMTSDICDSVVIGSPATTGDIAKNTLIDTRNNKTYLVAKYADGHCWMRENLNYVLTANSAIQAYNFETGNTFSYTPNYSTQTETGTLWAEDASDGTRSFQQDKDLCIGGMDIATSGGTGATCDANKPYERIGVIYNWAAATAQTGEQAKNAGSSGQTEVKTSICPKGWRLPTNSGDYSFSNLMGSYSLPTGRQDQGYSGQLQNPLNFNRPGFYGYSNGALIDRGTGGHFWSSVGFSSISARGLNFYSSYFFPQGGNYKGNGLLVRCVAV